MKLKSLRKVVTSMICLMLVTTFVHCRSKDSNNLVVVPDLRGKPYNEAIDDLRNVSLKSETFEGGYYASIPKDYVVTQVPYPLTRVKPGRVVKMELSKGISSLAVPLLVGMKFGDAYEIIHSLGFYLEGIDEVAEAAPPGTVLEQFPPSGSDADSGSGIRLTIALPEIPVIPDWIGQHFEEVKYSIIEQGFILGTVLFEESPFHPRGVVYIQDPIPYSPSERGVTINIVVNEKP